MNYLDIKKDTTVFMRHKRNGKIEIHEARFNKLLYRSNPSVFYRTIIIAGVGEKELPIFDNSQFFRTEEDAINKTNEIRNPTSEEIGELLSKKHVKSNITSTWATVFFWDGTKVQKRTRTYIYDVLNDTLDIDIRDGEYFTKEECETANTIIVHRFPKNEKKTFVVNVFHESVEKVTVEAYTASEAKEKAFEKSTTTPIEDCTMEWLGVTDTEVDSVNGVKTYGKDEPLTE